MEDITLKVCYNGLARRFRMPIKTEWENLAKHLRFLYQLGDNSALSLQYTDEDGDLVSLSTEFELRDVLEQASGEGKRTVKFTLLVSELPPPVPVETVEEGFDVVASMEEPDMGELVQAVEVEQLAVEEREEQVYREAVAEEELREDPVIVQAALEIQAQEEEDEEDPVLVEQVKHVQVDVEEDEEDEESLYVKPNESVKVEEDDLPPYVVARNEEEEEDECQAEEQREEEESSGSNKGKQPASLSLAEQLHGLVDQFVGILEQHPEFVAQASIFKDRIMNNGKIDIHVAAKFVENEDNQENIKRKAKCSHKEDKKCKKDIKVELQWGGEQENHHSHHYPHHPHHHPHHQYHHHHQHHQQQPSSSFSFQPLCTPQIQPFPITVSASDQSCPRRSARVTAQRLSSEFHEKPYSSGRKQQDNVVEDAIMSAPPSRARCFKRTVHQAAGRPHCSRRRSSPNNMPPDAVVEQEVNEKMIILSEMGFMDQELNKMLLQENNDDVAKVVDILMSRE